MIQESLNIAWMAWGRNMYLPFQLEIALFNFRSILTLKGPGFSDSGMAGEGTEMEAASLCCFIIWIAITMEFGTMIPEILSGNIWTLDNVVTMAC